MIPFINRYVQVLCIGFAFIAVACNNESTKENKQELAGNVSDTNNAARSITFTQDQYKLSKIQIGNVEQRKLSNVIKLTGMIDAEPSSVATISAPLGGYVRTAGLLPGTYVKKGQLLATLENPEFISIQQEYLESLGRLEFLEQDFKRQQTLREEDVNAAKTFQQVGSDFKIVKARVAGLEQKMTLIGISATELRKNSNILPTANLYAPIAGFIKESNVNIGKYVAPTDILFEIIGVNELHLALNAFEKDIPNIKVGQVVRFALSNESTFNRTAKVFLVGRAADDNKMVPIHCHFPKENGLLPGMYVKAWLETGAEVQTAVPAEAIVQLEGLDYLVILTDSSSGTYTFQLMQIARGIEQDGYTAVEFASSVTPENVKVVMKNSYTVLSAIKNAEEEE
ncbi:MAG: efflux RND transporter periplasmic adaptor subunit [Flavipsychrobacter sp.]|nr:efflux RND transporter periplasmic adaptor subunit [Flavipsychrobacter sp.]